MSVTEEISATGPHGATKGVIPGFAPPLVDLPDVRERTASEEARTIVENDYRGSLVNRARS